MKLQTKKQKKLFLGLIVTTGIVLILGLLFMAVLSKENKDLVTTTITNFMNQVKGGNLNMTKAYLESVISNGVECLILFFLGMSIIGMPIIIFMYLSHAFILGFSISSIFYVFGMKGIFLGICYIIPQIINLFLFLILCYYATLFSKYLFYFLFLKKEISFKRIIKRYLKVFSICLGIFIISSALEAFVVPYLLSIFL